MKNLYKMTIAAVLAATMGAASAVSFTGTDGNNLPVEFEFSSSTVTDFSAGTTGAAALTSTNDILRAIGGTRDEFGVVTGGTQGTVINLDKFWKSFVSTSEVKVFHYDLAAPMIEELVFTVKGEAYGQKLGETELGWHSADEVVTDFSGGVWQSTARSDLISKTTNVKTSRDATIADVNAGDVIGLDGKVVTTVGDKVDTTTGTYLDSNLEGKGNAALSLLAKLGFTGTNTHVDPTITTGAALGAFVDGVDSASGDADGTVVLSLDPSVIAAPVNGGNVDTTGVAVMFTGSVDGTVAATISRGEISNAQINADGFNNANALIGLIADQLKNGYLLDVEAATASIAGLVKQHRSYLGASIVDQARTLKSVIKTIGLQTAAADLGKVTLSNCDPVGGNGGVGSTACVKTGQQFEDIRVKIAGIAANADEYNTALYNIDQFANSLISFFGTVGSYDGADAASDISSEYGTIAVDDTPSDDGSVTFYDQLLAAELAAEAYADSLAGGGNNNGVIDGDEADYIVIAPVVGFIDWADADSGFGLEDFTSAFEFDVISTNAEGTEVTTTVAGSLK